MTEAYVTLEDIRRQKSKLRGELKVHEKNIRKHWHTLFRPSKSKSTLTPSSKLKGALSMSVGIIDGALLGWKLYRKFKK